MPEVDIKPVASLPTLEELKSAALSEDELKVGKGRVMVERGGGGGGVN